MRLIALIVAVYLLGAGVALAPTVKAKWDKVPASRLVASVAKEVPSALGWPGLIIS
jgi:Flp pilus assembly pilin Flp